EVAGRRLRVAGVMGGRGRGAGLMPVLFCSLRTAREVLPAVESHQISYLLARCHRPEDRAAGAERLRRRHPDMTVLTAEEFSRRTRLYWLTKTRAGLVLAFSALLGLVVGAVISGQTLYSATAASLREYAVLRAMGIPRWRMAGLVLAQSFWVAAGGVALGIPITLGLARLGLSFGGDPLLPPWPPISTAVVAPPPATPAARPTPRPPRRADPPTLPRATSPGVPPTPDLLNPTSASGRPPPPAAGATAVTAVARPRHWRTVAAVVAVLVAAAS